MKSKSYFPQKKPISRAAFAPIESPMQIRKMILSAEDMQADCVIWITDQKVVFRTQIIEQKDLYRYVAVSVKEFKAAAQLVKKLQFEPDQACFAIIYLKDQAIVGFKAVVLGFDSDSLRLSLPSKVLQLQRRKDQRLKISDGYVVQVALRHPADASQVLRQKILDLSVGGFSFAIPKELDEDFFPEQILKKLEIMIRRRSVFVDVKVQSITQNRTKSATQTRPQEGGGSMRVGVSFDHIDDRDLEYLSMYIVEHTIQYQI